MPQETLNSRADFSDSNLVDRFVSEADPAAFEAIVRRHGSMVLSVCCRVLRKGHDAEDAFQATFLVFFREADSIRSRSRVASWLYGVPYRSARKLKSERNSMRSKEMSVQQMPEPLADAWMSSGANWSRQDFQKLATSDNVSDAQLAQRLASVRQARDKVKADLAQVRKELTDLVTQRQEAILFQWGILAD